MRVVEAEGDGDGKGVGGKMNGIGNDPGGIFWRMEGKGDGAWVYWFFILFLPSDFCPKKTKYN